MAGRSPPFHRDLHTQTRQLAQHDRAVLLRLTRRLLRRGEFTSRQDLSDKILHFNTVYNQTAKPYRWTGADAVD